jgi:hypothetical protein
MSKLAVYIFPSSSSSTSFSCCFFLHTFLRMTPLLMQQMKRKKVKKERKLGRETASGIGAASIKIYINKYIANEKSLDFSQLRRSKENDKCQQPR